MKTVTKLIALALLGLAVYVLAFVDLTLLIINLTGLAVAFLLLLKFGSLILVLYWIWKL